MTQWVIDAVQLGELRDIPAEEIYFKDRTRRILSMPLVMFVLRSNGRTVVVDTGGPVDEEQIRRNIPLDYVAPEAEQAEGALAGLGVGPGDVDLVVNTHLHWDHCSNNELFRNAEIPRSTGPSSVTRSHPARPIGGRTASTRGPSRRSPGAWTEFARSTAEPRSRPAWAFCRCRGTHPRRKASGSTTGEGTYVITGDCVDTLDNWDNAGAALALPSGRFTDLPAFYTSLARLKGAGWTPLPSHDHTVVEEGAFDY